MSQCKILHYAAMDESSRFGAGRTAVMCQTHNMRDFDLVDDMCPIGRIEHAADQALELIDQTMKNITRILYAGVGASPPSDL